MTSRPGHRLSLSALTLLLVLLSVAQVLDATPQARAAADIATPSKRVPLTVSAAISLKEPLEQIKTAFARQYASTAITFNFGASGMLEQQIENGAPVDVFLSAAAPQMDALQAKQLLLPGTRRDLVGNQLVLIVRKGSSAAVSGFADLARPNVTRVALGEPSSVPAGQYAQEVLRYYKVLDAVQGKSVLAKDVRQVLTYVETGNVDAGIVYRSDALAHHNVEIAAQAPEDSHSPIRYPVAIIRESRHPEGARQFLAYLFSESSGQIFVKHGFLLIAP